MRVSWVNCFRAIPESTRLEKRRKMNRELEGLICHQTDLHVRIALASENIRKLSTFKIMLGLVEARLQSLETNWARFEAQHDKLVTTYHS